MDDNQQVTSEVFVATYYEKVSPHLIQYDENKSTVAPGEDEENLEASENEHDDLHDDEEEEVPEIVMILIFICNLFKSYLII